MSRRSRRLVAVLTCVTVLALVPVRYQDLGGLRGVFDLGATAWAQVSPPLSGLRAALPAAPRPQSASAHPPEKVVLLSPGAKQLEKLPDERLELDFDDASSRGPGLRTSRQRPGEPVVEIDLRLRGVPGVSGRKQGKSTVFEVPADTRGGVLPPLLAALLAQPAPPSPTAPPTASSTPTPTSTATPRASGTARPAVTATATPDTNGNANDNTNGVSRSRPSDRNTYQAHLELKYEPSDDGREVKETILLRERPSKNLLSFSFETPGLTSTLESDGSISLRDQADRLAFTIPAPTFQDARGKSGTARYSLSPGGLDVVLEPGLVATGALPLEVDPSIISAPGLWEAAPAPWQRQSVVATDGTQFFAFYDTTSGSTGVKFSTSTDNFASVSSPTTIASGLGTGGFSVEIDALTDTVYVGLTGSSGGNNVLRVYPLSYNGGSQTWTVGSPVTVQSHATNSWSGASLVIERGATDYLWIGADERVGSSYTYKTWQASLATVQGSPTWTSTTPGFTSATSYVHYGGLVAISTGVAAVGRDGSAHKGAVYARGSGWGSTATVATRHAWNLGKEYSLLAVADPLAVGSATFVPLVAYAAYNPDSNKPQEIRLAVRRVGDTTWSGLPTGTGAENLRPQLTWDGTSFYLFRLQNLTDTNWQVQAQRGKLVGVGAGGEDPTIELDPDRVWVVESSGNKDLTWLGLPRTLGTEIIPLLYIRDKSTDELVVDARRVDLLGERSAWEYQELTLPGAGQLKVNLANGNLHYQMVDADFPTRRWNDTIRRVYDAQSPISTTSGPSGIMGVGWTGEFTPLLQFYADQTPLSASNGSETRVEYWASDGSKWVYLKDGSNWRPELGLKMELDKPNTNADKVWKLDDLFGNTIFFTAAGRPTLKKDGSSSSTWTFAYSGGNLSTITGVTGRTQTYTFSSGKVTKIRLANPSPNSGTYFDYDYTYDGSGRLVSATLVSNSTEFDGSDPAKRVRVSYGYDSAGLLSTITTPTGSVYSISYDSLKRVTAIDLPDPSSGAVSTCGLAHCWRFAYAEGQGQVTLTDPNNQSWVYRALGSGPVHELIDPLGNSSQRTWTAEQNRASETDPLGNTTSYAYDIKANRTTIIDPVNGAANPTTFGYNNGNKRNSKTDARGNTTSYTYTGNGDLDVETDAEGFSVDQDYDSLRLLTSVTDARGKVTTLTYDSHGQLASESRPDGSKTTISRDLWGRPTDLRVGATSPASSDHLTRTVYDDLGREKTVRVRMGSDPTSDHGSDLVTAKTYDRDGNLLTTTDPKGGVTTSTPDKRGRVVAVDAPLGNGGSTNADRPCSAYQFDQLGNQTASRLAISRGASASCSFGASGLSWLETQVGYDARNLKTSETIVNLNSGEYSGGTIARAWQYDAAGRPTRTTDSKGNYVELTYDALGQKLSAEQAVILGGGGGPGCHGISGAVCSTTRWEYDRVGNVTTTRVPRGSGATQSEVTQTFTYDEVQRPLTRTNELGKSWSSSYDGNGNLLTATDPLGQTTTRTYDNVNRLLTVKDALNNQTTYTYDKWGNRLTLTDPNGGQTGYSYDKANRLISVTDPLTQASSFLYDPNGNRTSLTDPRGKTQSAQYDALNRMIQETTPSATSTSCPSGCAVSASTSYTLDGMTSVSTDFNGTSRTLGYDPAGNRTGLSGGGTSKSYNYDDDNRLTSLVDSGVTTTFSYDQNGSTTSKTTSGTTTSYSYDGARRLTGVSVGGTSQAGFTYDGDGVRTSKTSSGATTSYVNDSRPNSQAPSKLKLGSATSYRVVLPAYDPSRKRDGDDPLFDNLGQSRLWSVDGQTFASDASYQRVDTSLTREDGRRTLRDSRQPLLSVAPTREQQAAPATGQPSGWAAGAADDNASRADLRDDAGDLMANPRLYKPIGTQVQEGDQVRQDTTVVPTGRQSRRASTTAAGLGRGALTVAQRPALAGPVFLGPEQQAPENSQVLQQSRSGTTLSFVAGVTQYDPSQTGNAQWAYFHTDALNNRVLSDGSATVSKRWEYDPFGVLRSQSGSASSEFQYAGEQKDGETGLINLRARYYDATVGRFLQRDRLLGYVTQPSTFNRYSYALNNPVLRDDPSGLDPYEDVSPEPTVNETPAFDIVIEDLMPYPRLGENGGTDRQN